MMDDMMGGGMGLGLIVSMVFSLLLIVGLVFLIVWGVERAWGKRGASSSESALEILKKRYARGEISREEFEEKKQDLIK